MEGMTAATCPTVPAVVKGGLLKVVCPFCRRTHYHTVKPGVHRAHCGDGEYRIQAPEDRCRAPLIEQL
jgi:hypothetical protein